MRRTALVRVIVLFAVANSAARAADAPGPVSAPAEVIAAHNAWADSIRHIWSRAAVTINVPIDKKREQHDLDGHFFIAKPDRLFVHGQVLGQDVFRLGMNAERFWLWIRPGVNTVWTGRRGGKGERDFLLSPADLMAAYGMSRIDLARDAAAEFVAGRRHYVLTEQQRAGGALLPHRRIWFDRTTLRPVRVDLFDDVGRRLVMAELLAYQAVGDTPVCTTYRARFYGDEDVALVLRLSRVSLEKKPNPRLFEYRLPPGANERDLDAPAAGPGPTGIPLAGDLGRRAPFAPRAVRAHCAAGTACPP